MYHPLFSSHRHRHRYITLCTPLPPGDRLSLDCITTYSRPCAPSLISPLYPISTTLPVATFQFDTTLSTLLPIPLLTALAPARRRNWRHWASHAPSPTGLTSDGSRFLLQIPVVWYQEYLAILLAAEKNSVRIVRRTDSATSCWAAYWERQVR